MYTIEIKTTEKIFSVVLSGFMKESESREYLEEFKKKIKTIKPSDYFAIVDTKELHTASQDLVELMQEAQELIVNTPFKARCSIMPKNILAQSQIKRVGVDEAIFDNTIFAESYDEALRLLS